MCSFWQSPWNYGQSVFEHIQSNPCIASETLLHPELRLSVVHSHLEEVHYYLYLEVEYHQVEEFLKNILSQPILSFKKIRNVIILYGIYWSSIFENDKTITSFSSPIIIAATAVIFIVLVVVILDTINSTFFKQEIKNLELSIIVRVKVTNCVVSSARCII